MYFWKLNRFEEVPCLHDCLWLEETTAMGSPIMLKFFLLILNQKIIDSYPSISSNGSRGRGDHSCFHVSCIFFTTQLHWNSHKSLKAHCTVVNIEDIIGKNVITRWHRSLVKNKVKAASFWTQNRKHNDCWKIYLSFLLGSNPLSELYSEAATLKKTCSKS